MELHAKEEWENFVVEQLRGPNMKEFGQLKTDGERFKYCKTILRNSPTGQEIIEFIQKLLNTRGRNGKSQGNIQEYWCVGEEHIKRRDFKKAVICFSMAIQQAQHPGNSDNSSLDGRVCEAASSNSADNVSRSDGHLSLAALYSRRAEVLFEAREYKACLNDVQEAMSLQCPQAVSGKLACLQKSCFKKLEITNQHFQGVAEKDVPAVTGGLHNKIANGSSLIEINCTSSQGRFLQASNDIRAGDTLISEAPYAAVLLPENAHSHCDYCFQSLVAPFPCQHGCEVLYCSPSCRDKAWVNYHKVECGLSPLLNVVDTLFRLSLRILLITGTENILDFLKGLSVLSSSSQRTEDKNPNRLAGCGPEGEYLGNYSSVFSLVTNTELQPIKTLMSHALNSALLSEFLQGIMIKDDSMQQITLDCENCINNQLCQSHKLQKPAKLDGCAKLQTLLPREMCASLLEELDKTNESESRLSCVPGDVMGCLLFHHSQQMACNVHAITSIVSTTDGDAKVRVAKENVVSREQKRIATAVYPTASLLNHACDPDVIVSFFNGNLVVRATHNISKGSEISHCYGPHVSRMRREDRQKLLYKQYFFTCQCAACKSDEEMENKRLCFSAFACPKCKQAMKLSSVDQGVVGTCQNRECSLEKSMLEECRQAHEAELLFVKGIRLLERVGVKEALDVFHECLRRRKGLLHKYHKDLAETHDAIARCYAMTSDFKKASHFCSQSSEAVEKSFGSTSVEYAHELHKLSQLLFNDRQVKKALSTIDKASSLLTRHYGRSNPDVRELSEMKRCLVSVGGHSRINNS